MKIEVMKQTLRELLTEKRYAHSLGVMEESVKLAKHYECDMKKAEIAGLLHDCAKSLQNDELLSLCKKNNIQFDQIEEKHPSLLHARVGAVVARDSFDVIDEDILVAISSHTSGRINMTDLEKIVLVADFIEPNRTFEGVEKARELAYIDINKTLIYTLEETIIEVLRKGQLLHPTTVMTRNWAIEYFKRQ